MGNINGGQLLVQMLERDLASGKPACLNVVSDSSVIFPVTMALIGGASAAGLTDQSKEPQYCHECDNLSFNILRNQ